MTTNLLPELFERPFRKLSTIPTNLLSWAFDEDFLPQDFSSRGIRIYEENGQLNIEAPLPGLNLEDIEVSLNQGVLIIKGSTEEEEKDQKRKYYRSSRRNYSYSLALPTQIDETQEPQANYVDGILHITLKLAKQAETKKITVTSKNKSTNGRNENVSGNRNENVSGSSNGNRSQSKKK